MLHLGTRNVGICFLEVHILFYDDGLLLCFVLFLKDAVSKYQEVTNNLEFAKELQRSFMALSQDVSKEQVVQCGLSAAIPNT